MFWRAARWDTWLARDRLHPSCSHRLLALPLCSPADGCRAYSSAPTSPHKRKHTDVERSALSGGYAAAALPATSGGSEPLAVRCRCGMGFSFSAPADPFSRSL